MTPPEESRLTRAALSSGVLNVAGLDFGLEFLAGPDQGGDGPRVDRPDRFFLGDVRYSLKLHVTCGGRRRLLSSGNLAAWAGDFYALVLFEKVGGADHLLWSVEREAAGKAAEGARLEAWLDSLWDTYEEGEVAARVYADWLEEFGDRQYAADLRGFVDGPGADVRRRA